MALTKLTAQAATEDTVFTKEISRPPIRQHFSVKQLDQQIAATQARLAQLQADRAEAMAVINAEKVTEEPK